MSDMKRNPIKKSIRAIWNMKSSLPLAVHLLSDGRVARADKLVFLFVIIGYLLFPYDFIFDFPLFGHIDDLAIFLYMVNWFITRTPKQILEEYGWSEVAMQKRQEKAIKKREKETQKREKRKEATISFVRRVVGKNE